MFEGFGRDLLKAQGLRPDSVMQVALQLAYYRWGGVFRGGWVGHGGSL